jgi:hypothetical protein
LEEKDEWIYILSEWDDYNGWVEKIQSFLLEERTYDSLLSATRQYSSSLLSRITGPDGNGFLIPLGSTVYSPDSGAFTVEGNTYLLPEQTLQAEISDPEKLIEMALQFLHSPYLWGGRTVLGLDCSGFTQVIFKACGIRIPRDSNQQALFGKHVNLISEALPGDLAFFEDEEGTIVHTGLIMPEEKIIHSSGRVRIDRIDHHGIYDEENKRYSHKLRAISRVL